MSRATAKERVAEPLSPSATLGDEIETVGGSSSSVTVSVAAATVPAPWLLASVADTVTDLSGWSMASSLAAMVTVPVLAVASAATVSVLAALRLKSPAWALAPAVAVTVTVVTAADGCDRVAVTVAVAPSAMLNGASVSVAFGAPSSSVVVTSTSTWARPL